MANLDLSKYGITGVTEILHNPSYDVSVSYTHLTLPTKLEV